MVFAELSDTNYVGILLSDFEYRPKGGSHFVLIMYLVVVHVHGLCKLSKHFKRGF